MILIRAWSRLSSGLISLSSQTTWDSGHTLKHQNLSEIILNVLLISASNELIGIRHWPQGPSHNDRPLAERISSPFPRLARTRFRALFFQRSYLYARHEMDGTISNLENRISAAQTLRSCEEVSELRSIDAREDDRMQPCHTPFVDRLHVMPTSLPV